MRRLLVVLVAMVAWGISGLVSDPAYATFNSLTVECHKFTLTVKGNAVETNTDLKEEVKSNGDYLEIVVEGTHSTDASGDFEFSYARQYSGAAMVCGTPASGDEKEYRITAGTNSATVTPEEKRSWWEHILNWLVDAAGGEATDPARSCLVDTYDQAPLSEPERTNVVAELSGLPGMVPPGGFVATDDFPLTVEASVSLTEAGAPPLDPVPSECASFVEIGGIAELPPLAETSADASATPADGTGWPVGAYAALAGGLAAAVVALTAGAWYARRRWLH